MSFDSTIAHSPASPRLMLPDISNGLCSRPSPAVVRQGLAEADQDARQCGAGGRTCKNGTATLSATRDFMAIGQCGKS